MRSAKIIFLLIAVAALGAALWWARDYYPYIFLLLGLLAALFAFYFRPEVGLYLMALSLPVINWNFYIGSFDFSFIEALTILVLAAFCLRMLIKLIHQKDYWRQIKWPLFRPFAAFFAAVLISSLLAQYIRPAVWYSVRWILFFYLGYIWLPYNIVKDGRILKRTIIALGLSGLAVAAMGIISLHFQDWYNNFFRIQPIALFGIYPIGDNHNLIAEFLVIVTFFVLSLKYFAKSPRAARFYDIAFLFLLVITLGTLSRTAWIVLALEILVYLFVDNFYLKQKKPDIKKFIIGAILILALLSPFFVRMGQLQASNESSTASRLLLSEIAWQSFLQKPFFGYGSGMFVTLVSNNVRFTANYGDPLDSHGIWQKILAENGIFGIITFAIFIIWLFWEILQGLKRHREAAKLLLPLAIGSLGGFVYQWFNTSYYKGKLWLPLALTLAAVKLLDMKAERLKQAAVVSNRELKNN